MESQCWKAKEIWYEKCREVSKPINMMCWSCVVRNPYCVLKSISLKNAIYCLFQADAVPKCDTVEVEKQIEVFCSFYQHDLVPSLQYIYTVRISENFYEKLKRVNFQENPKPSQQISWIQNWEQENAISFLVLKRALSSIIENVSKGTESLFQEVFPLNPKVNGN